MANQTIFKNKLPLHKTKLEVFVFILIASISFSSILFYIYTYKVPIEASKFPSINITCDGNEINRDNYIECMFELYSENSDDISPIKSNIKIRGDFNAGRPKKGYRIELSQPKTLLGMRKDDDWILFAMYFDIPRIRIKTGFDLWKSLEQKEYAAIFPELKYVSLYINGEYQGLYLLAEKNDRRLFGLDDAQNNLNTSLIIQKKEPEPFWTYYPNDWEQDWPNEDEDIYIMDEIMTDLIAFFNSADEEFFDAETGIYTKFDKENLVDFFLFNFFILHKDIWNNNFFIIRNTYPSKFYLIPWDFDYIFGQKLDRKYKSNENPESDIHENNVLFSRLISNDDFSETCKKRWFELREEVWTEEFVLDMLYDNYEEIKDILKYEAKLVYKSEFKEDINLVVDEAVEHLFQWIPERLDFCDSYFLNF